MEGASRICRTVSQTNSCTPKRQEITSTKWEGHQTAFYSIPKHLVTSRSVYSDGVGSMRGRQVWKFCWFYASSPLSSTSTRDGGPWHGTQPPIQQHYRIDSFLYIWRRFQLMVAVVKMTLLVACGRITIRWKYMEITPESTGHHQQYPKSYWITRNNNCCIWTLPNNTS